MISEKLHTQMEPLKKEGADYSLFKFLSTGTKFVFDVALSFIPVVSNFLATLENHRINEQIQKLNEETKHIPVEKMQKAFENPSVQDLFLKIIDIAKKNSYEDKMSIIRRLFIGTLQQENFDDQSELYIQIIDELSIPDFEILKENFIDNKSDTQIIKTLDPKFIHYLRLEKSGLIININSTGIWLRPKTDHNTTNPEITYQKTNFLQSFIQYLEKIIIFEQNLYKNNAK